MCGMTKSYAAPCRAVLSMCDVQAATTAIVQHPEHNDLYARDPFCAGFCGAPLHALLDIAAENQACMHCCNGGHRSDERSHFVIEETVTHLMLVETITVADAQQYQKCDKFAWARTDYASLCLACSKVHSRSGAST